MNGRGAAAEIAAAARAALVGSALLAAFAWVTCTFALASAAPAHSPAVAGPTAAAPAAVLAAAPASEPPPGSRATGGAQAQELQRGSDWGPPRDIAEIREIELGIDQQLLDPHAGVTGVSVAHGYALVGWKTPQGAGESLYCRTTLGWNRIAISGGLFDVVGLVGSGVPPAAVEIFKAHVSGGLAQTSGMNATTFRKLTGRCL
ncbi:MAG: hypothetical protein ACLPYS_19515 [Vulcanimicrobiaceae bacterium]